MDGGVCKTKSMKLVLRVGQSECHVSRHKSVLVSEKIKKEFFKMTEIGRRRKKKEGNSET